MISNVINNNYYEFTDLAVNIIIVPIRQKLGIIHVIITLNT